MNKTIALMLACCFALACGGGGSRTTTPPGITARFAATNPNPGATTMSLASGGASGPAFEVQVLATGFTEFFGAGFHVVYNPASASFTGFDCSGSFLPTLPANEFDCQVDGTTPGVVIVVVTRVGANLPGVDVPATDLLLSLTFRATSATAGNAFGFDAAAARFVKTCPAAAPCSDVVGVTWSGGTLTAN